MMMAVGALFGVFILKGLRWQITLFPIKKLPFKKTFSALMIGYFAHNILPFRMGEFMRVYYLRKNENLPSSSLVGSVFAEKFFDGLSLILIAISVLVFAGELDHASFVPMLKIVLYIVGGAGLLYLIVQKMPRKQSRYIRKKLFFLLKPSGYKKVVQGFKKFFHGFHSLHSVKILSASIFTSLVIWFVDVLGIYFLMLAFGVTLPDLFLQSLMPLLIINMSVIIPTGPGDIGLFHLAGQKSFESVLGLDTNLATSLTILLHFITILPGFVLGGYFMIKEHIKIDLKKIEHEQDSITE
jgi:uncharacterized protein (TIRG00374 family)